MGQVLACLFRSPTSGAWHEGGRSPTGSAGFTEEELCQNLHKRSEEEQQRILQRGHDQRVQVSGMTFEDWSHRLGDRRQAAMTSVAAALASSSSSPVSGDL